jgi:hypothetical protein
MPTVRPVRRTRHSTQLGTLKRCISKAQTFAAITAILIRFINTTLENMTEKQRGNIDALIDSDKFENWEMAYQLAIGIGDDAFTKGCLVKIYARKIVMLQTKLDELAAAVGISPREAYATFARGIRNEGIEGNDEAIATYFEQASVAQTYPDSVMIFDPKELGKILGFGVK